MQNSFLRAKYFPPAVCPPVELCLFWWSCLLLERVWRHIHSTPTEKTLGSSRLVSAQPSTSAWHDLMYALAPASSKSSSAVLAVWSMPVRQGLLTWVQHHSDGSFAMSGVSHWLPQLLAVLIPATCVLLPCPKSHSRIHTTARNVVIPSCFSFAYLKRSNLSYWAINRKTPWLHLWLLLCRSNITAAVIALCMWSLRKKRKIPKPKQQVPEFSRRVATCPHYSQQVVPLAG